MSIPQVGQGSVAVVPTFKGFRKTTDAVFGTSAKSGKSIFDSGFKGAGLSAGQGFAKSFDTATKGLSSGALKGVQAEVAKASREVATVRLREADAVGKVRIAETSLAEARRRYAADSSQVVRAEERLAAAQRAEISTKERLLGATDRLTAAQRELASASVAASSAGGRSGGVFASMEARFGGAGRDGAARFSQGFKDVLGGVLGANILTGIGYTVGREIGDAARAGIGYTLQSVGLASDLEQSTGGVTAQFKDQADVILAAAKRANTAVGLSRSTYQQYATVVGAQLKNLGIRQDQVAGNTTNLIGLGADLAAQFGGPTSQAVEALSSLLRGERDPIERYGVSIKQADIDARLAAQGLSDLTGEAEKQAQVQATLAILWEQTADAQGTFFREQDTYAGKQQRLMAQLADAQTEFGNALLPTAIDALTFVNDDLLPVLKDALDRAGPQLSASLRAAMPEIEATLKELGENLPELINLGGTIASAVSESIGGDFGEGGIIGGIPRVKSELEGFGEWLTRDFSEYADWEDYWGTFGAGFEHWWDVAWDGVDDGAAARALATTERTLSGFQDKLAQERAYAAGSSVGEQIAGGVTGALEGAKDGIYTAGVDAGTGFALGLGSTLGGAIGAAQTLGRETVRALRGELKEASPSKVTRESGRNFGRGYGLGMLDELSFVQRSAASVAAASLGTLSPSASLGVTAARTGSAAPPIYVQNPFTGEYLLAQVGGEADARISAYDQQQSLSTRLGR